MKAEITEAQGLKDQSMDQKIDRQMVSWNIIKTLPLPYHSRQENE